MAGLAIPTGFSAEVMAAMRLVDSITVDMQHGGAGLPSYSMVHCFQGDGPVPGDQARCACRGTEPGIVGKGVLDAGALMA